MAESKPAATRATMTAAIWGTTPTITQQIQLSAELIIYNFLRPKVSDQGERTMDPTTCPRRKLLLSAEVIANNRMTMLTL